MEIEKRAAELTKKQKKLDALYHMPRFKELMDREEKKASKTSDAEINKHDKIQTELDSKVFEMTKFKENEPEAKNAKINALVKVD